MIALKTYSSLVCKVSKMSRSLVQKNIGGRETSVLTLLFSLCPNCLLVLLTDDDDDDNDVDE